MINDAYKYSHSSAKVIGHAMAVHKELGNGFQEVIYQRALEVEMNIAGLTFIREFEMPIFYRDQPIGTRRVDFLVEKVWSVELKAINALEATHFAQAINYLEAFNLEVGLLINSGEQSLKISRLLNKKFKPHLPVISESQPPGRTHI